MTSKMTKVKKTFLSERYNSQEMSGIIFQLGEQQQSNSSFNFSHTNLWCEEVVKQMRYEPDFTDTV